VTARTAAHRYARAVFDVARQERADLDTVEAQLSAFATLVAGHSELERVLLNPAVPAARKRAAVLEIAARGGFGQPVAKLLGLLAERDRIGLLADVLASYRQRLLSHQHVVRAEVTTAQPIAFERAAQIERGLAKATGRKVVLSTRVDPSLIGGAVTRIGSTVYDGSVARQLEKIKERLDGGRP
jgi:F-type H+-transporting ATPase subunit delta